MQALIDPYFASLWGFALTVVDFKDMRTQIVWLESCRLPLPNGTKNPFSSKNCVRQTPPTFIKLLFSIFNIRFSLMSLFTPHAG